MYRHARAQATLNLVRAANRESILDCRVRTCLAHVHEVASSASAAVSAEGDYCLACKRMRLEEFRDRRRVRSVPDRRADEHHVVAIERRDGLYRTRSAVLHVLLRGLERFAIGVRIRFNGFDLDKFAARVLGDPLRDSRRVADLRLGVVDNRDLARQLCRQCHRCLRRATCQYSAPHHDCKRGNDDDAKYDQQDFHCISPLNVSYTISLK